MIRADVRMEGAYWLILIRKLTGGRAAAATDKEMHAHSNRQRDADGQTRAHTLYASHPPLATLC